MPRLLVLLSACAAIFLQARPSRAAAVERDCPGPTLEADAAFRERFPQLLERLRSELPARAHVDACARVELRLQEPFIVVKVSLLDGRIAAREVARHEDVLPTLQALLLVPEEAPLPPRPTSAPPSATPNPRRTHARRPLDSPATLREEPSPLTAPRDFGFELSLLSGARTGDGQVGYGAGVLSFLELKGWLLGFQGRADGYRPLLGGDPETALALGFLAGRRFDLGVTALDLTAGPAVVMRGAAFSDTEATAISSPRMEPPPPPPPKPDVAPLPRLLLAARFGFMPHSVFRTFIGVDGELGPTRRADVDEVAAPGRMPAYTVGLSLGATLGTR